MRVLIVKLSSMGDVLHTLPALTDAAKVIPGITFDWAVEPGFADIPKLHPHVDKVIPISLRKWRKLKNISTTPKEFVQSVKALRKTRYDLVLDAQGLLKSGAIARLAKGLRVGLDRHSAREFLASIFYQKTVSVDPSMHAITRVRTLFATALGYQVPTSEPEYGIEFKSLSQHKPYLVFLHGTTWKTKHWPEEYWESMGKLAFKEHFLVKLPWGSPKEKERAERLAAKHSYIEVLPKLSIKALIPVIGNAAGVVSVDTGLGHLTAALGKVNVSLYGPTKPEKIGATGKNQIHLSENTMELISPETVWDVLLKKMRESL